MKDMKFKNFLALVVIIGCFVVAIGEGAGWFHISEYVLGALFSVGFTLVIQHYFRKTTAEGD